MSDQRRNALPVGERSARRHTGLDRAADVHQRARVERAPASRELGRFAHIGDAAEVGLDRILDQRDRLARLPLAQRTTSASGDGRRASARVGAGLARGCPAEPGQDGGELEELEIVLTHAASVRPVGTLQARR